MKSFLKNRLNEWDDPGLKISNEVKQPLNKLSTWT